MKGHVVSLASEFPNDNDALHDGVVWSCLEPCGPVSPQIPYQETAMATFEIESVEVTSTREERPSEVRMAVPRSKQQRALDARSLDELMLALASGLDDEEGEPIVIEEFEADFLEPMEAPDANDPAEAATPFHEFASVLVAVVAEEASRAEAATLAELLANDALPAALDEDAMRALREGGLVEGDALGPSFAAAIAAWRAILDGTSEDFSACGGAMLDEWSADLCARWIGAPERTAWLRRSLRSRGVAAFGLTLVA